jgi:hypothetical protein
MVGMLFFSDLCANNGPSDWIHELSIRYTNTLDEQMLISYYIDCPDIEILNVTNPIQTKIIDMQTQLQTINNTILSTFTSTNQSSVYDSLISQSILIDQSIQFLSDHYIICTPLHQLYIDTTNTICDTGITNLFLFSLFAFLSCFFVVIIRFTSSSIKSFEDIIQPITAGLNVWRWPSSQPQYIQVSSHE